MNSQFCSALNTEQAPPCKTGKSSTKKKVLKKTNFSRTKELHQENTRQQQLFLDKKLQALALKKAIPEPNPAACEQFSESNSKGESTANLISNIKSKQNSNTRLSNMWATQRSNITASTKLSTVLTQCSSNKQLGNKETPEASARQKVKIGTGPSSAKRSVQESAKKSQNSDSKGQPPLAQLPKPSAL